MITLLMEQKSEGGMQYRKYIYSRVRYTVSSWNRSVMKVEDRPENSDPIELPDLHVVNNKQQQKEKPRGGKYLVNSEL